MAVHEFHIVSEGRGLDIILRWRVVTGIDKPRSVVPQSLMFGADWIYNLTTGKIIKNRGIKPCYPAISAIEVDHDWLIEKGYLRRATSP